MFWKGDPLSSTLLIGEAPGAQEDQTGYPFMGPAGVVLERFLREDGLDFEGDNSVFLVNVIGCRPVAGSTNRAPHGKEVQACLPRLEEVINAIHPWNVVLMGKTAESAFMGQSGFSFPLLLGGLRVFKTTHPAAFLYGRVKEEDEIPLWKEIGEISRRSSTLPNPTTVRLPLMRVLFPDGEGEEYHGRCRY